jgi:TPR repeat protein
MRAEAFVLVSLASLAPFALLACKDGDGNARSRGDTMGIPSSPPIQIANVMAGCDDVALCARECDAGAADRCRRLGVTYEFGQEGDASKNETLGTAYFDRSCEMGNASGCVSSGQMHEYAHGVPVDLPKATAAYEKACTIGWQVGCANYAIMLEYGRGVPKDLVKARTLYDGACKAGAGLACDRLKVLTAGDGG